MDEWEKRVLLNKPIEVFGVDINCGIVIIVYSWIG